MNEMCSKCKKLKPVFIDIRLSKTQWGTPKRYLICEDCGVDAYWWIDKHIHSSGGAGKDEQ